jgi:DNA-directed RNA polymerase subunit RPC12/RpoP
LPAATKGFLVSPLVKYYLATLGALCGLLGGSLTLALGPRSFQLHALALIALGILSFAATRFVRCPNCRWRLATAKTQATHGLPGRNCPRCGYDLGRS